MPENCYVIWDIIPTTASDENAIRDVFIFVEDNCKLTIHAVDLGSDEEGLEPKRLGDILNERGEISQIGIDKVMASLLESVTTVRD